MKKWGIHAKACIDGVEEDPKIFPTGQERQ